MKRSKWALLLAALLCIVQAVMPMTVFAFTAQTPTRVPEIGEATLPPVTRLRGEAHDKSL